MISSIEITRFRGIREGKLEDLTPLTILVGPNGCGKSTVLDAMLVGAASGPGGAIVRVVKRHRGVEEGARWLFWQPAEDLSAEIVMCSANDSCRKYALGFQQPGRTKACSITWKVEWQGKGLTELGNGSVAFSGNKVHREGTGAMFGDIPAARLIDSAHGDLEAPLHQLYSESSRLGHREEAKALLRDVVPSFRDIEILTEADKPILYLIFEHRAIPVALAGDGIHALARIAFELASCPSGVVLLEEPEVHQHPGAIWQTARAILAAVRREIQVILTTHSLELIDALVAESSDDDLQALSLYRLELADGRLIPIRAPGSQVAFSRCEVEKDLR